MSLRAPLLLLLLATSTVWAQAPLDDAALPEGIEATGDTAEVRSLTEWANQHLFSDSEQAERVTQRALALARNLDDQRGIGESLRILGNIVPDPGQKEAYYTAAREVYEQIGDERGLYRIQSYMGDVYRDRGELEQALVAYFEALKGFERLGNVEEQAHTLNEIGIAYRNQGNLEEALANYQRAITLAETLDKPRLLTRILNNFGLALSDFGSYEDAEPILLRGLAISREENDRRNTAIISNNLGFLFNKQGRHEEALPFLFAADSLANDLGIVGLLFAVYDELGKAYLGLGEYGRALNYANQSLAVVEEEGGNPRWLMDVHQTLSQIHKAAGNPDQTLIHYEAYMTAKDSAFNVEKAQIITEMQTRYETEEKQRAIERFEQENRIQTLQLTLLLGGIVFALLVAGLFYYRYRVKQKANRLLEELDSAKSRFFANISHEFRTPLTVILGSMQDALAGRFGKTTEKLTEQHQAVLRNSRQLQRLIDEVLDLNRLEAGKLELHPTPGDLVRSVKRIVEANAPLAERNGVNLAFGSDVEHCPRLYDQEKLEKIAGNLLSNALKFTPEGGSVRVELRCTDRVEIAVSDTGPGIPAEMQEKIFERFSQVEDGSLHGGTGIGLALAKELAELHGGTIRLESEPRNGSTFTVRLPLEETTLDDVQRTAPQKRGGDIPASKEELEVGGDGESPSPNGRGDRGEGLDHTTVLVIEDNNDVRAFVRRSLEETYRVLEAADGETGLQQARSELPDLIVSDIMLPGIDGYEIARRLKAEADTECIPVVMLTARAGEEDQTEGYGSGAEVYITKPFVPDTLRAAVARLLEERKRLKRRLQKEAGLAAGNKRENGHATLRACARATLLENFHDENFGVEELASALNMTRFTLYHRFKSEVGSSPSKFVQALRMERARELLSDGAGTVSEVAYAVGYNSRVGFSRAYSAHYGVSPSTHLGKEKN